MASEPAHKAFDYIKPVWRYLMTQNVGGIDRILRIVAGVAVICWGIYAQNWLGAIGLVPLVTGLMSWCPAYLPFGLSTRKSV
jgi:type IV secretory pathway TrbD component